MTGNYMNSNLHAIEVPYSITCNRGQCNLNRHDTIGNGRLR
jgi:hypothetical protein